MTISELDLARLTVAACVSTTTIRRVLNGERTSVYSRERTLSAARQLGLALPESARAPQAKPAPTDAPASND